MKETEIDEFTKEEAKIHGAFEDEAFHEDIEKVEEGKRMNLVNHKSDEELICLMNAPYETDDNDSYSARVLSKEEFQERVKKHGLGMVTYISKKR